MRTAPSETEEVIPQGDSYGCQSREDGGLKFEPFFKGRTFLCWVPQQQAMSGAAGLSPDPGWEGAHCHGELPIPGTALAFRAEWGLKVGPAG